MGLTKGSVMADKKREALIQRVAEIHDTWFVEEASPPGGGRMYRIRLHEHAGLLFEDFRTAGQVHSFLDGYEVGRKDILDSI